MKDTTYDQFKADHPAMIKMAEEHAAETERMAQEADRREEAAFRAGYEAGWNAFIPNNIKKYRPQTAWANYRSRIR